MAYLSTKKEWAACLKVLETQKAIGLDSEFYNVDFDLGQSCVNRARIHVWSVAVLTGNMHPRGYFTGKGAVLPVTAIPYFQDVLQNPNILKTAHNSNVDVHAFYNHGVDVMGIVNTLSLARFVRPGRKRYNLDEVGTTELGAGKADSYNDLFRREKFVEISKTKVICRCGDLKCKADPRQVNLFDRVQHVRDREYVIKKLKRGKGRDRWLYNPITNCVPGHPLWERFRVYAEVDAIRAIEWWDKANRIQTMTEVPWYEHEFTNHEPWMV